jgi:hypothetical protein
MKDNDVTVMERNIDNDDSHDVPSKLATQGCGTAHQSVIVKNEREWGFSLCSKIFCAPKALGLTASYIDVR